MRQNKERKMKKSELVFLPVVEKPNPSKMIYLSVKIDGSRKTRIDANIKFDNDNE